MTKQKCNIPSGIKNWIVFVGGK